MSNHDMTVSETVAAKKRFATLWQCATEEFCLNYLRNVLCPDMPLQSVLFALKLVHKQVALSHLSLHSVYANLPPPPNKASLSRQKPSKPQNRCESATAPQKVIRAQQPQPVASTKNHPPRRLAPPKFSQDPAYFDALKKVVLDHLEQHTEGAPVTSIAAAVRSSGFAVVAPHMHLFLQQLRERGFINSDESIKPRLWRHVGQSKPAHAPLMIIRKQAAVASPTTDTHLVAKKDTPQLEDVAPKPLKKIIASQNRLLSPEEIEVAVAALRTRFFPDNN